MNFYNAVHLTHVLNQLAAEVQTAERDHAAVLSPYTTKQVLRFGDYVLDLTPPTEEITSHVRLRTVESAQGDIDLRVLDWTDEKAMDDLRSDDTSLIVVDGLSAQTSAVPKEVFHRSAPVILTRYPGDSDGRSANWTHLILDYAHHRGPTQERQQNTIAGVVREGIDGADTICSIPLIDALNAEAATQHQLGVATDRMASLMMGER